MNVFSSGHRNQPWVWQVTGLCFILGMLLAGSLHTVRSIRRSGTGDVRVGMPPSGVPAFAVTLRDKEKEITRLREQNTKLENSIAQGDGQAKALNEELQKVKLLAGLTAVRGPGIVLTLQDSKKGPPSNRSLDRDRYIIHDVDLQAAVNELGASGAEAMAINGQRLIARTAIRCVGPTIMVNSVPITPPYEVKAIGDPGTMASGLNLPWGVLDGLRRYDPEMFKLEKRDQKKYIELPGFTGSTEVKYSTLVRPTDKDRSGQ